MNIAQLQVAFQEAILYYIDQQIPGRRYFDVSVIGTLDLDGSGYLYYSSWLISDINQPTNADLMVPTQSTVLNFFALEYTFYQGIAANQPFYKLSGADLDLIMKPEFNGFLAFDTTAQDVKKYDSLTTSWNTI